jgi:hypothetical protein
MGTRLNQHFLRRPGLSGLLPSLIAWLTRVVGVALALVVFGAAGLSAPSKATAQEGVSGSSVKRDKNPPSTVRHVLSHCLTLEGGVNLWDGPPGDCNDNGLPDSIDIAQHMEDDVNGNGIADYCDPVDSVRYSNNRFDGTWQEMHNARGASYFRVRHNPFGITIRYTVPPGGARVTLDLLNARNHVLGVIHAARDTSGAYEINWDKTLGGSDEPVSPGRYTFRLRVAGRSYTARQRWLR